MRTPTICCLLLLASNYLYSSERIEVLAVDYPPFTTSKVSGNGVSFRLLKKHLGAIEGLVIEPVFLPPARLQQRIKAGEWCFSFYPVSDDRSDVRFLALADRKFKIGLYHQEDDPLINWTHLAQLKGYRVALLRTDRSTSFFNRFTSAGMIPVFVDHVEQGLRMLQRKRVDVALGDEYLTDFVFAEANDFKAFGFAATPLFETSIGLYINNACSQAKLF